MKIIGHRGAAGLAPENTVQAVMKALEYGADEIEVDIRVSKDSVAVLHHGAAVVTGLTLMIRNSTLEELRHHKADLATLEEAIDGLDKRRPLILNVQPGEPTEPVAAIVRQYLVDGWQPEHFRFASFSQHTLRALHAAVPEIPTIVNEAWSGVRANFRARQLQTKRIAIPQRWLWFGFIRGIRRGGYQLAAYGLNDRKKARQWERAGLYAVVTEYPDRFKH
jgi:glycerophosphoryl diester phosphodiesterase